MKLIIDDFKDNDFKRSECDCSFCKETHNIVDNEWAVYKPSNNLQRRMLKIIKNIEKNYLMKKSNR